MKITESENMSSAMELGRVQEEGHSGSSSQHSLVAVKWTSTSSQNSSYTACLVGCKLYLFWLRVKILFCFFHICTTKLYLTSQFGMHL